MEPGLTVVICTYNGALLLPETLRHISEQQVRPGINWEIILIDNASTDESAGVAISTFEKYPPPVPFYLHLQPRQGLTYAREMALEKAKYEFVLFCDDDNWLCPDYVERAYDLMTANPTIGVLGGHGELIFEATPPRWALGHGLFANGPQAGAPGKVRSNLVYGAGFVLRKSAYEALTKAGFRPMLTDRVAASLSAGGDLELCYAIALSGYDIWYNDQLRFKHYMPVKRISWEYYLRFVKEGASSFKVLVPYRIRVTMGGKNLVFFHLFYLRAVLSYTLKFLLLYLQYLRPQPDTEMSKSYFLRLTSLRYKIMSFRSYKTMKSCFVRILQFEQEQLHKLQPDKPSRYSRF